MKVQMEKLDNAPSSSESEKLETASTFSGMPPVDNLEKVDGFELSESEEKVGDSPSFSESEESVYINIYKKVGAPKSPHFPHIKIYKSANGKNREK